jgi:hypothetical protein
MTPQEWTNGPPARQSVETDTIDLELIAHAVWRWRWLVAVLTVLGFLAGIGISTLSTRYLSRGLLLTPEVTIANYKRYEVALANEPRLERFLQLSGRQNEPVARLMRDLVEEPSFMAQAVRPVFSFTDRDAKQFGVKVEEAGELVGIELQLKARERPKDAPVLLLAEYVRDTAISVDLEGQILKACLDTEAREQELRGDQLDAEFEISQLESRAARLREVMTRVPDKSALEVRQVVSLEHGGDRFLPPGTQLASTEIAIADKRVDEVKRERDRVVAEIHKNYYCEARKVLEKEITGRDLLLSLPGLQNQAVAGRDLTNNAVERAANALALQGRRWSNRYLAQMRFVASPQGALTRVRKPGRVTGAALGMIVGGLLGVLLAVSVSWWRRHREEIVADDRA